MVWRMSLEAADRAVNGFSPPCARLTPRCPRARRSYHRGMQTRVCRLSVSLLAISVCLASVSAGAGSASNLSACELELFEECFRLIERFGSEAWLGWTAPPLLIAKGDADYLIGHPSPPPEAVELLGAVVGVRHVFRIDGHLVPVVAATAWPVAGTWCVAIAAPDELQAAVDLALGEGVIVLTTESYIRATIHEAFHAHQMETLDGLAKIPSFDEAASAAESGSLGDAALLQREASALAMALTAITREEAASSAAQFLQLRATRRTTSHVSVSAEESAEWIEGSARYAETRLWLLAGEAGHPLCANPEQTWTVFLEQLWNLTAIPGTSRDVYYAIGAAEGFVLDRLGVDWKAAVLPGRRALERLLADAVGAP